MAYAGRVLKPINKENSLAFGSLDFSYMRWSPGAKQAVLPWRSGLQELFFFRGFGDVREKLLGPTASFPHLQVQNPDGKWDQVESEAVSTVLLVSWPYRILSRALRRRKESSISFSKGNMCTLRLACGRKTTSLKCISAGKTVKVMCLNAAIVPSPREWQATCCCFRISCCWQASFLFKGRKENLPSKVVIDLNSTDIK